MIGESNNKKSLRFRDISKNGFEILKRLCKNQKLKRYLKYLDDDPLGSDKPDIIDSLIDDGSGSGHFFATFFNDTVQIVDKAMIFVNPYQGNFYSMNKNIMDTNTYTIDIIVNNSGWVIKDQSLLRAFEIAHEVAREVDQERISGIGKAEIVSWKTHPNISKGYTALTLFLEINNTAVKGF